MQGPNVQSDSILFFVSSKGHLSIHFRTRIRSVDSSIPMSRRNPRPLIDRDLCNCPPLETRNLHLCHSGCSVVPLIQNTLGALSYVKTIPGWLPVSSHVTKQLILGPPIPVFSFPPRVRSEETRGSRGRSSTGLSRTGST